MTSKILAMVSPFYKRAQIIAERTFWHKNRLSYFFTAFASKRFAELITVRWQLAFSQPSSACPSLCRGSSISQP
jgi:hypothetical protein